MSNRRQEAGAVGAIGTDSCLVLAALKPELLNHEAVFSAVCSCHLPTDSQRYVQQSESELSPSCDCENVQQPWCSSSRGLRHPYHWLESEMDLRLPSGVFPKGHVPVPG